MEKITAWLKNENILFYQYVKKIWLSCSVSWEPFLYLWHISCFSVPSVYENITILNCDDD